MTLPDLLKRVEAASGPDRELDAEIAVALSGDPEAWVVNPAPHSVFSAVPGWWRDGHDKSHEAALYTASLDATLSLATRLGFYIRSEPRFHIDGERVDFISYALRPRWQDWRPDDEWFDRGEGRHADQALSALCALLQALIAHTPSDGAQDASNPEGQSDAR